MLIGYLYTFFEEIYSYSFCIFKVRFFKILIKSNFSVFSFAVFSCAISKKALSRPIADTYYYVFFWDFGVSAPAFSSMIHFELIFVNGVRKGSSFIISHIDIQYHLFKKLLFLIEHLFTLLKNPSTTKVQIYFWMVTTVPLFCLYSDNTLLEYRSFDLCFEVSMCESSNFVLLLQECFGHSSSFVQYLHMNLIVSL